VLRSRREIGSPPADCFQGISSSNSGGIESLRASVFAYAGLKEILPKGGARFYGRLLAPTNCGLPERQRFAEYGTPENQDDNGAAESTGAPAEKPDKRVDAVAGCAAIRARPHSSRQASGSL
jgi:hypothetical protein